MVVASSGGTSSSRSTTAESKSPLPTPCRAESGPSRQNSATSSRARSSSCAGWQPPMHRVAASSAQGCSLRCIVWGCSLRCRVAGAVALLDLVDPEQHGLVELTHDLGELLVRTW
eukprot:scaffold120394_cov26-Phaeocystis_antarctica.AAC.1